ncbi:tetratricopeptide repeat protein [Stieleria varia]|uniref:Tol-pal system protein YbgF n=1 Tax=Stieleria varia TaxID=2528005 RepID=A0A5C6AG07_9BACT|nr:tetratricopeptide repeat protein [Stieleria varia]TWT98367.1 tol-pal system protein YbgF [Stieleria varia]
MIPQKIFVAAFTLFLVSGLNLRLPAAESTEESLAAYADAANFQTNGAIDLAIQAWKKFLDQYPDDDMASKAAHYLGVCYMQRENPDYAAAANAFETALQDKKYELREESLANQGWCHYASAGDGPQRDENRLKKTIATFETLRKEKPKSEFLDRALFYSGEAAYGLGDRKKAIEFYNDMLALPQANESPLRCDALYARGIAYEEIDQFDQAVASYKQLLTSCENQELATDVHLRMGDVMISRKEFDAAVQSFESAFKTSESDDDKSYAVFREAYALVQAGKPDQAALQYERLLKEFPDSVYAANATMAAAQSLYRAGKTDEAAERFRAVLGQNNPAAATESAHWLARIELAKNNSTAAVEIARKQLAAGAQGEYAVDLKLDLAEALAVDPKTIAESVTVAEEVYRESPDDPLAARALYNAAFSALQTSQQEKSLKLANEFLQRFPKDELLPDVRFIAAESQLMTGDVAGAAESYQKLIAEVPANASVQRPLWVLRAGTTLNAAKKYDDTIALLKQEYATISDANQKAEAQFLVGQAHLMSGRANDAALSFQRCVDASPQWQRAGEAMLLQGTALFSAGKRDEAKAAWEKLVSSNGDTPMGDQARYKLAQLASTSGDYANAVKLYDQILANDKDKGLIPYTLYGRAWSLMQAGDHKSAVPSLQRILKETPQHPVADDALLARGISNRNLEQLGDARSDLEKYLALKPTGTNLGHALYELALIEQKENKPGEAAKRLEELVDKVPKYPSMEKVLYELGWSFREAGDLDKAEQRFTQLVSQYPEASVTPEAAYFIGQQNYAAEKWQKAAESFGVAAEKTKDPTLAEKSLYRLGWSRFKLDDFDGSQSAFQKQASEHPDGSLAIDALMMVGECEFKKPAYEKALESYTQARERIRKNDDNSKTIRDTAERQVRELVLLHGGQSAAQLKKWDEAIGWYTELKERFPATTYLSQVFYETGFAYQQKGELSEALKFFSQVADNYRNEVAARARFMMGEIHFGEKQFDKAIPEFQRVMYGFGAEKAPDEIKNWQAKSGFEAGRCSELLMQTAKTDKARDQSKEFAVRFFEYVTQKHPSHELATKSAERLEALK